MRFLRNAITDLAYATATRVPILPKEAVGALQQKRIANACPDLSKGVRSLGKGSERGRSLLVAICVFLEECAKRGMKGLEEKHAYDFLGPSVGLTETEIGTLKQTVTIARKQGVDLRKAFDTLKKLMPGDDFINLYAAVLYLEMYDTPEQRNLLEQFADEFDIDDTQRAAAKAYFTRLRGEEAEDSAGHRIKEQVQGKKDPLSKALKLLECDRTTPKDEIRSRYRKLVLENHPDRLLARKAKAKELDQARERMLQISQAYDIIRRNWSQLS